jgi:predicted metal-dependent enzyme (double-stranded beta helix superfamily)
MPTLVRRLLVLALVLGASATVRGAAAADGRGASADSTAIGHRSTYANLQGEVVLENERVRVEKFLIAPGMSTGLHTHPADQLLVFVKGGVLTTEGRSTLWRDGRVEWRSARAAADPASTNAGAAPIEIICVNLKPVATHAAAGPDGQPKYRYLNYPNIPGEDLLENEFVIVQRFTVNPGQWEGVHAHHPDMLYIHIKGGQWAARSKTEAQHPYPEPSPDGEVGWMPTIPLSVGHESGNIGTEPIDLIWVTLKK